MKSKLQLVVPFLAIVAGGLAMVAPAAFAGDTPQNNPGQVATRLGSPDPREHSLREGAFAGLVPTRLGSQDPRDTARVVPTASFAEVAGYAGDFMFRDSLGGTHWSNARVAHYTSSGLASASAGLVASRLGSPDPRDTARRSQ
jgi:hypothetical protein